MNYVIIGASAAGLAAAETIRSHDRTGRITVLTDEAYLPYSRPSISYYLKGSVRESGMYLRKSAYYRQKNIEVLTNSKVTQIDRSAKAVFCGRRKYPYDKLCIATGSKPFVPPMENVERKDNVYTFLDFASVKKIKEAAGPETRAVVVGAGLIGLKAAEGLSKVCKSVTVVELADRVLSSILDTGAAKPVKKHLEANGLTFCLEDTVVKAESRGRKVTAVELKSGRRLRCDLLVAAVGVRPHTELAEACGLEVARGIVTDPKTMATSDPDIFAAGDCVSSVDMLDGQRKIIALWPNAVKQGIAAGMHMCGVQQDGEPAFSVNAIDFYGMRISTCGIVSSPDETYTVRVQAGEESYKRLVLHENRLAGYILINASENAGIYTALIANATDLGTLCCDVMETPSLFYFDKPTRITKLTGGVKI